MVIESGTENLSCAKPRSNFYLFVAGGPVLNRVYVWGRNMGERVDFGEPTSSLFCSRRRSSACSWGQDYRSRRSIECGIVGGWVALDEVGRLPCLGDAMGSVCTRVLLRPWWLEYQCRVLRSI